MFCTKSDIIQNIRVEELDAITRTDDAVVDAAILAVETEAIGYLAAYDTDAMFSATGTDRDPLLLSFIKDMATYEVLDLSPLNQDLDDRRARWKRAVDYLKGVQQGSLTPNWPKLDTDTSGTVLYGSQDARNNYY